MNYRCIEHSLVNGTENFFYFMLLDSPFQNWVIECVPEVKNDRLSMSFRVLLTPLELTVDEFSNHELELQTTMQKIIDDLVHNDN